MTPELIALQERVERKCVPHRQSDCSDCLWRAIINIAEHNYNCPSYIGPEDIDRVTYAALSTVHKP